MSTNIFCVSQQDATLSIHLGDGVYLEVTAFNDDKYLVILDPGLGIGDMTSAFVDVDTLLHILETL